MNFKFHKVV